jgi:hypothetical protein
MAFLVRFDSGAKDDGLHPMERLAFWEFRVRLWCLETWNEICVGIEQLPLLWRELWWNVLFTVLVLLALVAAVKLVEIWGGL